MLPSTYESLLDIQRMWMNRADCFVRLYGIGSGGWSFRYLPDTIRGLRDTNLPLPNIIGLRPDICAFNPPDSTQTLEGGHQMLFCSGGDSMAQLLNDVRVWIQE